MKNASSGKQVIHVPDGPPEHPFLSPAIRAGDLIYVSGNVGLLPGKPAHGVKGKDWMPGKLIEGGIETQTRQTIANLKIVLAAAGAGLEDVVKVNTFLRDIDRDFHGYNDEYQKHFVVDPPARSTVQSQILNNILVEIECVAYKPVAQVPSNSQRDKVL